MTEGRLGVHKMQALAQGAYDRSPHGQGLEGGNNQEEILMELLAEADRLCPHPLHLQLISGSHPTYAFIGKPTLQSSATPSDVKFGAMTFIRNLDARQIVAHRQERTALTLSVQWRGREVNLGN